MKKESENVFNAINEQKVIEKYNNALIIATEKLRIDLVNTINNSHIPPTIALSVLREIVAEAEKTSRKEIENAVSKRQGELTRELKQNEEEIKNTMRQETE